MYALVHPADTDELMRHESSFHSGQLRLLIDESEFGDGGVDGDVSCAETSQSERTGGGEEKCSPSKSCPSAAALRKLLSLHGEGNEMTVVEEAVDVLFVTTSDWETILIESSGQNGHMIVVGTIVVGVVGIPSSTAESSQSIRLEMSLSSRKRCLRSTGVESFGSLSSGGDGGCSLEGRSLLVGDVPLSYEVGVRQSLGVRISLGVGDSFESRLLVHHSFVSRSDSLEGSLRIELGHGATVGLAILVEHVEEIRFLVGDGSAVNRSGDLSRCWWWRSLAKQGQPQERRTAKGSSHTALGVTRIFLAFLCEAWVAM